MSQNEMNAKVRKLRELQRQQEDLAQEIEALKDAIKAEMTARDTDELDCEEWTVSWKEVTSSRFDITRFRKERPVTAGKYMVTSTYKRFLIA